MLVEAAFRLLLGRRLPITGGGLHVSGIRGRVRIRRDRWGVAYVDAENDEDAWFGLGFCHGQDRTFQLETLLRVLRGTLAELVGPEAVPVDRISRRIGFARAAHAQLAVVDDEVRRMAEAYASGVTAGASRGLRRRPHEFALLRARPSEYGAAEVLGMLQLMSFLLASNWDSELMRYRILLDDGPEAVAALDPAYPEWLPVSDPVGAAAGPALDRLADDLAAFAETVAVGGGSNNWAVSGDRTAGGRPILANDPHLAAVLPPHWYLARVRTPEWVVAGASFVGVPGIVVGFNGRCAWGVTAGLTDNTDLFVEEIGPDGRSVREGDEFVPCRVHTETISVKGSAPIVEQVLETPRGPIVGPALPGAAAAISLRAVWLDARPLEGFLRMHRVGDFDGFRRCWARWPGLPLNVVYADVDGHIGWQLVGECPVRRKGWGTVPLAGWDPDTGWEEQTLSVEVLPHLLDPEEGFVATANNRPRAGDDGPFLGYDFIDGYRLARIDEVLAGRADWDLDGVGALQMDRTAIPWREMRDVVLGVAAQEAPVARALALLQDWDGVVAPDSPAATVFELFVVELTRRVVVAKAPRAAEWALGKGFSALTPESAMFARRTGHLVRLLRERPDGWFDRPWETVIAEALASVLRRLESEYGADPAGWSWGRVRPLTLKHPFGARPPLHRVFDLGPFPWGGDASTVNQAAVSFLDPTGAPPFVASLRMAVDVGNWSENRFVLPGGQSGNPCSPHYADQLDRWRNGGGVTIAWEDDAVAAAVEHLLDLDPA